MGSVGAEAELIRRCAPTPIIWLPQVKGVPIVAVSGLTGEGLDRLMEAIVDSPRGVEPAGADQRAQPLVRAGGRRQSAARGLGRRLKLNYITQAKARPPSFVLFCSRADAVPESYLRYLVNGLRETFEMPGTPIRIDLAREGQPVRAQAEEAAMTEVDARERRRHPLRRARVRLHLHHRAARHAGARHHHSGVAEAGGDFVGGDTARAARDLGLFGTAWALMQFLFSPVLGALSDRFGRRPVMLLSNFGLGLDYMLMALAPTLAGCSSAA